MQCIVDKSFYSSNSRYILAAQFASESEEVIVRGDFITIVAEEFRHPYAAEICRVLAYLKTIDNILTKYPNVLRRLKLAMKSNYQAVINNLQNTNPITLMSKHLYQIIREIKLIVRQQSLDLVPEKIKAHQDDMLQIDKLTWNKYLNILCDTRAKELICKEKRLEVGFLFKLSSGYITSEYCVTVINDKEGLEVAISLSTAGEYLQSKLRSNIRLCRIDQRSCLAAMNKL